MRPLCAIPRHLGYREIVGLLSSAVNFVVGADVVQDYLMLGDLDAQDNAVRVGNAHGLLAGEFPRQVVEAKRWFKRVFSELL